MATGKLIMEFAIQPAPTALSIPLYFDDRPSFSINTAFLSFGYFQAGRDDLNGVSVTANCSTPNSYLLYMSANSTQPSAKQHMWQLTSGNTLTVPISSPGACNYCVYHIGMQSTTTVQMCDVTWQFM